MDHATEAVDKTRKTLDRILSSVSQDPVLYRRDLQVAFHKHADTLWAAGYRTEAQDASQQALKAARMVAETADHTNADLCNLARSLFQRAEFLRVQSMFTEALPLSKESSDILRPLYSQSNDAHALQFGDVLYLHALLLYFGSSTDEGLTTIKEAISVRRGRYSVFPQESSKLASKFQLPASCANFNIVETTLLGALGLYGTWCSRLGDHVHLAEAESALTECVKLYKKIPLADADLEQEIQNKQAFLEQVRRFRKRSQDPATKLRSWWKYGRQAGI